MRRAAAWILGPILVGSALSCSSARDTGTAGAGEPVGAGPCFNVGFVHSFSPVGQRFVYVRMTGDEQYLLTLDFVYPSLPSAIGIAIEGNFGSWVCSNTGAMIAFRSDGGRRVTARILGVESVSSLDEAKRLAAEREAPPKVNGESARSTFGPTALGPRAAMARQ